MNILKVAVAMTVMIIAVTSNAEAKPTKLRLHHQKPVLLKTDKLPTFAGVVSDDLSARRHRRYSHRHRSRGPRVASAVIVSKKTGAKAVVSAAYAPKFQAYIDEVETYPGTRVLFMGGIRRGPCHSGSLHPCGRALDVCQTRRGIVDARCKLPGRVALAAIALKNGLFEGGMWCNHDYGHVQAGVSSGACDRNIYAAVKKFKFPTVVEEGVDPEALAYDLGKPIETVVNVADKVQVDSFKGLTHTASSRTRHRSYRYARHRSRTRYARYQQQYQYYQQPTAYNYQAYSYYGGRQRHHRAASL